MYSSRTAAILGVNSYLVLREDIPLFVPVTFHLQAGESLHIKASNGGGKTTMLRSLYGMAIDYQGEVLLYGKVAPPSYVGNQAAYMNDRAGVFGNLTVAENLEYMLVLHARSFTPAERNHALAVVGLGEKKNMLAKQLSKGQKKRLHLARLDLLAKPIWLLDEPFDGLDQQGRELLRQCIMRHTGQGRVVVFSSHMDAQTTYQSDFMLELLAPTSAAG